MKKAFTITVLLALMCVGGMAWADIPVTLVGQWGGASYAVAVSGNRAYLGMGPRLVILDVSNPAGPTVLGTSEVMPDIVQGIAISGNYAYVADYDAGLQVIDISNPSSPTRVGGYDTSGYAVGVAVSGNYAYVADDYAGLQVIDISNPSSPTRVGGYDTSGCACGVAVSGNYAYVADYYAGLQVIDISGPSSPTHVGGYDTSGGYAQGVAISGNYAYVVCDYRSLQTIDVSNPASPSRLGGCDASSYVLAIAVSGNYAYLAGEYPDFFEVMDISNPASPAPVGGCAVDWAYDLAVRGNYAYAACPNSGLNIVEISNPAAPTLVGLYNLWKSGWYANAVAISGSYAYVAVSGSTDFGLRIINISNPASPALVGQCDTDIAAWAVTVQGNYAYLAGCGGLDVIDISNPASPTRIGGCSSDVGEDVIVCGTYCYIAATNGGLDVIDISDPYSPARVGGYDTSGQALSVAVSGNYAYVADAEGGLVILQVPVSAALTVTSITPNRGQNTDVISITNLAGSGFETGATVRLTKAGQNDILGTSVVIVDATKITCNLDLTGKAWGQWNVVVANPGGQSATLYNAFTVTSPAPTVTAITPGGGHVEDWIEVSIAGTGFQAGAMVKLTQYSYINIAANTVWVESSTWIECTFDLRDQPLGLWDVVVTNPDGQAGTLINGFETAPNFGSPPVIWDVTVSPQMVAAGDAVHIAVDATDDAGVTSVTANGTYLTPLGGSDWSGEIPADSTLGLHFVIVVASDGEGHTASNSSQSYKTARVVSITNRGLVRDVTSTAADNFLFRAWGWVTRLDADTFELDDGSGTPVRVSATGHGLQTGDYAFARGIWSVTASPHVLNSSSAHIKKVN